MNTIEVMKQALEYIEDGYHGNIAVVTNLRTAIKEMEQVEPVGWIDADLNLRMGKKRHPGPLYTHPQSRDAIIDECAKVCDALWDRTGDDCVTALRNMKGKK